MMNECWNVVIVYTDEVATRKRDSDERKPTDNRQVMMRGKEDARHEEIYVTRKSKTRRMPKRG